MASVAEARIEGIPYTEVKVGERVYSVPMPNKDYEQTLYWVKKALRGDVDARDILLGGEKEKQIYCGDDETQRWLVITETTEEMREI